MERNNRIALDDRTTEVYVAGVLARDFVTVGEIYGFAVEDSDVDMDNKVVLMTRGRFTDVALAADPVAGATGIAEGDPLVYDAANARFTDVGATAANAVAVARSAVAAGATTAAGVITLIPCF